MDISDAIGDSQQVPSQQRFSPSKRITLKPSLTPTTTVSSASSSPSMITPRETDGGVEATNSQGSLNQSFRSVRVPMPSPSRPRLDPRYAARLPQGMRSLSCSSPSTPTSTTSQSQSNLMPPPGITRESSESCIFRPTPIITMSPAHAADTSNDSMDVSMDHSPRYFSRTHSSSSSSDSIVTPRRQHSKRSVSEVGASDRFIPSRATSNFNFNLWDGASSSISDANRSVSALSDTPQSTGADESTNAAQETTNTSATTATNSNQNLLNVLLRSELLGENDNPHGPMSASTSGPSSRAGAPLREGLNHLRFQSPRQVYQENVFEDAIGPTAVVNSFSLTPVRSAASQRLMAAPPKRKRRISKVPFKVLDAPALQDDFYLNLVDWSSQNVLAVGLGTCVYLWSACTSKVTKLCDLSATEDIVTAVSWAQRGTHLSVGTNRGEVQLWDTVKCKKVRTMGGHSARVGTLAWSGPILASGSRDRLIYLRDVRVQAAYTDCLSNHKQEVCGLKWSFDEPAFLASGGNDNHLHVIDSRNPSQPVHNFTEHTAAVKAIAWSPHQHGLLASGGGTADRCIRFWNTLSGTSLNKIDTGSQVCNIAWSQNCNEIVSTHGYSLNQIVVWRYPSMSKVTTLTGHTYRVLYLAMSPDGSTVVTGAGDETLRFWQIFPGPRSDGKDGSGGLLFPNTLGSVIR
jgi:cell division cycle 20-like protein 1 (cofactor of APC complex)